MLRDDAVNGSVAAGYSSLLISVEYQSPNPPNKTFAMHDRAALIPRMVSGTGSCASELLKSGAPLPDIATSSGTAAAVKLAAAISDLIATVFVAGMRARSSSAWAARRANLRISVSDATSIELVAAAANGRLITSALAERQRPTIFSLASLCTPKCCLPDISNEPRSRLALRKFGKHPA
jgi:hypothetical protein